MVVYLKNQKKIKAPLRLKTNTEKTETILYSASRYADYPPMIKYSGGKFITFAGNKVCISDNGYDWITTSLGLSRISSLEYGNERFVAVDDYDGNICISTDGINWTKYTEVISDIIPCKICYAFGKFYLAGDYRSDGINSYPKIRTSTDGITWSSRVNMPNNNGGSVYDLFYANNRLVLECGNDVCYYTVNGSSWSSVTFNSNTFLSYANNKFVRWDSLATARRVYTSEDLVNWTEPVEILQEQVSPLYHSLTVCGKTFGLIDKGNNKYVLGVLHPNSLTEWDIISDEFELSESAYGVIPFTYGKGMFIFRTQPSAQNDFDCHLATVKINKIKTYLLAHGKDTIYAKDTNIASVPTIYAKNDESKTVYVPNVTFTGSVQSESLYEPELLTGFSSGSYCQTPDPTFPAATADNWEWNFRFKHKQTGVIQRIYSSGQTYPCGVEVSADNKLCLTMTTATNKYNIVNQIKGNSILEDGQWYDVNVRYFNGNYIVQSPQLESDGSSWSGNLNANMSMISKIVYNNENTFLGISQGNLLISSDCITWQNTGINHVIDIAYARGKFFVKQHDNNYYIITSRDGITWSDRVESEDDSVLGKYINNIFIRINRGFNSTGISYSSDGINYRHGAAPRITSGATNYYYDIAYGKGKFVICGHYLASSNTGYSGWSTPVEPPSTPSPSPIYESITYGNGKFVAVGYSSDYGYVTTSTDGTSWTTPVKVGSSRRWCTITYHDGKFIIVDKDSYISTSTDGTSWTSTKRLISYDGSLTPAINYYKNMFVINNTGNNTNYSYLCISAQVAQASTTKIKDVNGWKIGYEAKRNSGKTAFSGEIDLKGCYINVNGERWWTGTDGTVTVDKNNYDTKTEKIRRYI